MALFTAENAAEMARRGNIALAAKREREKVEALKPETEPREADEFRKMRLLRVRAQLLAVDKAIADEVAKENLDPAKLDRLASAAIRLNEQERQLSNRSLPPTLKANQAPARRKSSAQSEPEFD